MYPFVYSHTFPSLNITVIFLKFETQPTLRPVYMCVLKYYTRWALLVYVLNPGTRETEVGGSGFKAFRMSSRTVSDPPDRENIVLWCCFVIFLSLDHLA